MSDDHLRRRIKAPTLESTSSLPLASGPVAGLTCFTARAEHDNGGRSCIQLDYVAMEAGSFSDARHRLTSRRGSALRGVPGQGRAGFAPGVLSNISQAGPGDVWVPV